MPCYYTGSEIGDAMLAAKNDQKTITKLARLLCTAEKMIGNKPISERDRKELLDYFKEHNFIDAERKRQKKSR